MKLNLLSAPSLPTMALKLLHGYVKGLDKTSVLIPCAGQFQIASVLIQCGFEPSKLFTSDISLLSSILGYYYSNKLEGLPAVFEGIPEKAKGSIKAAYMLLLYKSFQLTHGKIEEAHRTDLLKNLPQYVEKLSKQLEKSKETLSGINYEIKDVRELVADKGLVIWDVPIVRQKESVGDTGFVPIRNFDCKTEFTYMWDLFKERQILAYVTKDLSPNDVRGAVIDKGLVSYWLGNEKKDSLVAEAKGKMDCVLYPIIAEDTTVSVTDTVNIISISAGSALYYRDLFSHKLAQTNTDKYFGIFLNEKLMGIFGLHLHEFRTMKKNYAFISFCMVAPVKDRQLNRLALYFIMSREFKDKLRKTTLKSFRYLELNSVRTTATTIDPNPRSQAGLTQISCEELENGMFKTFYEDPFTDNSYADCVALYLSEQVKKVQDVRIKRERRN